MNDLFAWVPWFQELAQKIAADGEESLIARTKEIPWNKDGAKSRLLKYGDQNIDPLSFFYVLASKNGTTRVYSAITEVFDLAAQVNFEGGFYYPTPQARAKLLFHSGGRGNTDLLWRLYRSAVAGLDSIKGHEFDEALSIKNVGVSKLTEALFLINPREFLPFDKQSLVPLQKKLNGANQVNNWETYRREFDTVRGLFPGCEPYEIQHFAYAVFGIRELDLAGHKTWRSSTYVSRHEDRWDDFRKHGWIWFREPPFALRHPTPGDLVLVHTGLSQARGIGIVHRNDHKEPWTPDQRLHVLWLNAADGYVSDPNKYLSGERFSAANKTLGTFREITEYVPTFDLITRIERHSRTPVAPPKPNPDPVRETDWSRLSRALLFAEEDVQEIADVLEDKKQVIFQGPPGTGKTYVARQLAKHLAGREDRVRLVQFHPSYAYEDFVQGYRPKLKDGQADFELRDGPLIKMARKSAEDRNEKHFLVIDEINRGNLSKILGELYFLLEYRDEAMRLQYSDKSFSLPPNLYIIGTMNTADRSIALVDLALRRRFHFVEFHPDKPPIEGLLGRWLDRHAPKMHWVEQVVAKANQKLDDRHAAIGPSYFMPRDKQLDEERVRRIWKHSVLPYVEEHHFGHPDLLAEFDLNKLRGKNGGKSTDELTPDSSEPTDANA